MKAPHARALGACGSPPTDDMSFTSRLSNSARIALLALAVPCVPVPAADLLDSWQAARRHDAGMLAAQATLRAAEEKIAQGDALLASRVDLSANAGQALQDYRAGNTASGHTDANSRGQTYGVGVVWSKPIYDASASAGRNRLHREAEQARVQYQLAEQDLILRVARSYFDVLLARENLTLATAQQEAVAEQLGLAKESYELGLTSITDADDAQARHDNLIAAEVSNANDLANKADAYAMLTSLDPKTVVAISATLAATAPAPNTLDDWLAQTRATNPVLRLLRLGVEIADLAIDQYKWRGAPVVSVNASVGRQFEAGSISASGGRDSTTSGAVGLMLSIPLFDGGNRESLLRQAIATQDQQRNTLEASVRESQRVTRQYFAALRDGAERIRALERARVSGESSMRSSKVGQEVGVRTIIDVLNAEQNYYQTLYGLTAARCDFLYAQLQLAASAGTLSDASLAGVNSALLGQSGGR
jgi:outer membrane protein